MNKEPLVSVISGYYNRESFVDESIQSLIDQTFQNIEIIIFDDCSTDNTYDQLKRFEYDNRVKIIRHDENIGFVRGLINAIKLSKGNYIAIHGSGDISYAKRIEKQVNFLDKNKNYCIVGCRRYNVINKKKYIYSSFNGEVTYEMMMQQNKYSHGEVMYRKDVYNRAGGYNTFYKYAQDRDLWMRMHKISPGFILEDILYERKYLKDSVSLDLNKKKQQMILSSFAVYSSEKGIEPTARNLKRYKNNNLAFKLFRRGVYLKNAGLILESFRRIKLL